MINQISKRKRQEECKETYLQLLNLIYDKTTDVIWNGPVEFKSRFDEDEFKNLDRLIRLEIDKAIRDIILVGLETNEFWIGEIDRYDWTVLYFVPEIFDIYEEKAKTEADVEIVKSRRIAVKRKIAIYRNEEMNEHE